MSLGFKKKNVFNLKSHLICNKIESSNTRSVGDKRRKRQKKMVATLHFLSMLQPQLIQLNPQTNRKIKQNKPYSPLHMEENQDPDPNFKLCKTPITNVSETCHIPEIGRSSTLEIGLLRIHRLSETFANHPTPVLEGEEDSKH